MGIFAIKQALMKERRKRAMFNDRLIKLYPTKETEEQYTVGHQMEQQQPQPNIIKTNPVGNIDNNPMIKRIYKNAKK